MNTHCDITLRPLTIGDIDAFIVWATDTEVTRHLRWEAYSSRAAAEEFFENVVKKHPWFQAIVVNDKVIGSLTLDKGTGDFRCKAELGYVSARKYWGKGLMTQVVALAVERGFQELGVARIEAKVHPANTASQRVLEKNGFVREALLKKAIVRKGNIEDLYLYALTR
ncbi:MAG: GNAT family N-acetyltransferase [Chthoniobacterales bacterium]|nr:GNAT family N-acetyltransferase [Chthoniobacterales bacterium]